MRQGPDRWALIRKEGSFGGWGGNTHIHPHTYTRHTYAQSSPSKHTHQRGGCPWRGRACLTSLIGFFSARSQGDEKLYQAEIINFALTTLNSLTLHFSRKMKKGQKWLLFSLSLPFLDSLLLLASVIFSVWLEETYLMEEICVLC